MFVSRQIEDIADLLIIKSSSDDHSQVQSNSLKVNILGCVLVKRRAAPVVDSYDCWC